jgi:hypothetical protein
MNESTFVKICVSVALCAIVALAVLPFGRAGFAGDGTVDPFHGASQMPGDPTNHWPSQASH